MPELSDYLVEHGPFALGQCLVPPRLNLPARFNELRDELIELRRKAAAYDQLFDLSKQTPTPYVFVQWKGTELCGDFHCSCGAHGHLDDQFAYSVECSACGRIWELPINLPLIDGRDEPHVFVQMDREDTDA